MELPSKLRSTSEFFLCPYYNLNAYYSITLLLMLIAPKVPRCQKFVEVFRKFGQIWQLKIHIF